jgi:hypothetical protein
MRTSPLEPDVSRPALCSSPAVVLSPTFVHPRLEVLETPAVVALFSVIRDKNTPSREFARHADRLMRYGCVAHPSC